MRAGLPFAGLGQPLPGVFFATLSALANGTPLPAAAGTPQPQPSTRFFGSVTVNGLPASGSAVVASVNGVNCGSGPIGSDGSYSLDIQATPACTSAGATVQFSIGGAPTDQTGTIPATPGPVRLNLTITSQHGGGGQPAQATPQPAQPANAAVPFSSCQSGQIGLQFLSQSENPPGLINDTFRFQVLGLAPGATFALYVAPATTSSQTDQFVATARQAASGTADAQGTAAGTLTLMAAHPAGAAPPSTLYAIELVSGRSCFDATASVPQQSFVPVSPATPTPCPASRLPESSWAGRESGNNCP